MTQSSNRLNPPSLVRFNDSCVKSTRKGQKIVFSHLESMIFYDPEAPFIDDFPNRTSIWFRGVTPDRCFYTSWIFGARLRCGDETLRPCLRTLGCGRWGNPWLHDLKYMGFALPMSFCPKTNNESEKYQYPWFMSYRSIGTLRFLITTLGIQWIYCLMIWSPSENHPVAGDIRGFSDPFCIR